MIRELLTPRDRLCKALQDRGTSPGLEGGNDRSARVSKESDVYSIRLSNYCKPDTTEVGRAGGLATGSTVIENLQQHRGGG